MDFGTPAGVRFDFLILSKNEQSRQNHLFQYFFLRIRVHENIHTQSSNLRNILQYFIIHKVVTIPRTYSLTILFRVIERRPVT